MAHDSTRGLYLVFVALLLLLAATVLVAQVDWGVLNVAVALSVAGIKTALIALFFMHLHSERGSVHIYSLVGIFWLPLLLVLIFADYVTRAQVSG